MLNEKILAIIYSNFPNIIFALTIFILFWISGSILKKIVNKLMFKKIANSNIIKVISGLVKNIMLILGIITALGTLGVNISAIVAGLGLTGFAFGFAFKDLLTNFISGILIFVYEPFKIGDNIEVDGKLGKVIDINLRYITLDAHQKKILIPNTISVSKIISVLK